MTVSSHPVDVRSRSPSSLILPKTPKNLNSMSRIQLLAEYDRIGDYWAVWLQKAVMLPETQDDYTDSQLRKVIALATSDWARSNWKYHDYPRYTSEHSAFYEEFFERWDAIIGQPRKSTPHRPPRRSARMRQASRLRVRRSRISRRNRHTKSSDIRRSKRPGPISSAAQQAVGKRSRGNDGKMYVVKADSRGVKRWFKT